MPLNKVALKADIQTIFDKKLENIADIAMQIAQAYQKYATGAMGPKGDPVILTGAEHVHLRQAFEQFMRQRAPAAAASNLIGAAVTKFWTAPPAKSAAAGVVIAIVVQAGIAKLAATKVDSSGKAAESLASALDMMTKTVLVFYSAPPPPLTGPIS